MKMQQWHYNVLFGLAVVGALVMLAGPKIGLEVRPEVVGVYGLVMAFILKQRESDSDSNKPRHVPGSEAGDPVEKESTHG